MSLNDKFLGTWVAEGLNDAVTKGTIARQVKQPDLINEIIMTDEKADEWLEDAYKSENLATNYREPPIKLGRYYNSFCSQNDKAYSDYKNRGIKDLALSEL